MWHALVLPGIVAGIMALPAPQNLLDRIDAVLAAKEAELVEVRRDIHRHPEISGNEVRTAALVAARLRALQFEVRTGVGGHGVVGVLRGGQPGPTVAWRADMDAVPSNDPDPVEYRSMTPGIRHICGHDVHTAIGLALAEGLAAVRAELSGTVMFIFQPAEERATGAREMLADGLFAQLRPDAVYGLHTSGYQVGRLSTTPGPMMAGRDRIRVELTGTGDLAAAADSVRRIIAAVGTIEPAAQFQPAPADFVMVRVGPGQRADSTFRMAGMLTLASPTVRARLQAALPAALHAISVPGVRVAAVYEPKFIAGVTNDATVTSAAAAAVRARLGAEALIDEQSIYPAFSEDFGSFQDEVPGTFFFLGVSNAARGTRGMPHSPDYVADDGAIRFGARAMAAVLLDRLSR